MTKTLTRLVEAISLIIRRNDNMQDIDKFDTWLNEMEELAVKNKIDLNNLGNIVIHRMHKDMSPQEFIDYIEGRCYVLPQRR